MPYQHLVSVVLPLEKKIEILQKLAEIKDDLEFLLSLQPDEVKSIFKVANGYAPFIEKAYKTVNDHPEIIPAISSKDEFFKDYQLSQDLTLIANQVQELNEGLEKTLTAINSDTLNGALEVYAAIKQHRDKVPGLNVVAQDLAEFFKKTIKKNHHP